MKLFSDLKSRIMSFPRVVPTAERKVNKRIRNLLLRGSLAYTVGFYGVGEYFGWWDKFGVPHYDDQNPEHVLHSVQGEDERSWQRITQKFTNRTMAESRRIVDKHFVQNLPIGMQNIINNPEYGKNCHIKYEITLIIGGKSKKRKMKLLLHQAQSILKFMTKLQALLLHW